jgi:oligosaccharide repeat unit polymerase
MAVLIVCLGLLTLTIPVMRRRRDLSVPDTQQGDRQVSFARLVIASAIILTMVLVGAMAFRSGVSAAAGTDFSELTLQQVREAQNGAARGGGLLPLLSAANPIAACLGIYGAFRYSRWWILLTAVAVVAAAQSPARTSSIAMLVAVVVFWLYARNTISRDEERPTPRPLPVVRLGLAAIVGMMFFLYVGHLLQKDYSGDFDSSGLPGWAVTPVLYFSGGMSALTVALDNSGSPFEYGSSIFLMMRAASVFFPGVAVPDTIGQFVSIPMLFNVYTGFGQIYFDLGLLGVAALAFTLGWLALVAHRKAEAGLVEWAWVSALTATILFTLPMGFRLFNLDVVLQLLGGFLIFWLIRRAQKTGVGVTQSPPPLHGRGSP